MIETYDGKVVFLSILGLIFIGMAVLVSWWFLIPVAVILWMNQRELISQRN